jgi:hypothetical protein
MPIVNEANVYTVFTDPTQKLANQIGGFGDSWKTLVCSGDTEIGTDTDKFVEKALRGDHGVWNSITCMEE